MENLTKLAIAAPSCVPANGVPKNVAHSAATIVPNFCHGISCGGVREQMACQKFGTIVAASLTTFFGTPFAGTPLGAAIASIVRFTTKRILNP